MQFIKLTRKNGGAYLLNIRHIIRVTDGTDADRRYVVINEPDTSEANQTIAVTETLYQIEQALDRLEDNHGVIVAADWPAEDPVPQ